MHRSAQVWLPTEMLHKLHPKLGGTGGGRGGGGEGKGGGGEGGGPVLQKQSRDTEVDA